MINPQQDQQQSAISRLARWWHSRSRNRAGQAELNNLDARELDSIARDVGTSTAELRLVAGKWPDSADLLARRMAMLDLDATETARTQPAVSRDMTKLCSLCDEKSLCKHELDEHAADERWQRYCANAPTLVALMWQRAASGPCKGGS